jgi:hypothetical protein
MDSTAYYLEEVKRLADEDYVPTEVLYLLPLNCPTSALPFQHFHIEVTLGFK